MATYTLSDHQPVTFFTLPRELRDIIYRMALVKNEPIDLWPDRCVRDYRVLSPRKCASRHYTNHECQITKICRCEWVSDPGAPRDFSTKIQDVSDCPVCHASKSPSHSEGDQSLCRPNNGLDHAGMLPYQRLHFYHPFSTYPGVRGPQTLFFPASMYHVRLEHLYVRDQHDLRFVRKELATGLLSTCRQIYTEAAPIFWHDNHFKFSGRGSWQGVLRFFLTIGPNARRHISSLEVCVPHQPLDMEWHTETHVDGHERILDGRSKNDPKLRMIKVPPLIEGEDSYVRQVCEMMLRDGAIRQLNLIIPTGCYFMGRREYYQPMAGRIIELRHPLHLLSCTEISIIVENGACLDVPYVFSQVDVLRWNLVCHPGACLRDPGYAYRGRQLGKLYVRKFHKYGFLEGIATMLGAEEECEVLDEESDPWVCAKLEGTYDIQERIIRNAPAH